MNSLVNIERDKFNNFKNEELFQHVYPKDLSQKIGSKHENLKQVINTYTKGQQSL